MKNRMLYRRLAVAVTILATVAGCGPASEDTSEPLATMKTGQASQASPSRMPSASPAAVSISATPSAETVTVSDPTSVAQAYYDEIVAHDWVAACSRFSDAYQQQFVELLKGADCPTTLEELLTEPGVTSDATVGEHKVSDMKISGDTAEGIVTYRPAPDQQSVATPIYLTKFGAEWRLTPPA